MASEYESAIQGDDVYNFFGNRVVKSQASNGRIVAVKVKPRGSFSRSEAEMMDFAAKSQAGILVPHVLGCYSVDPGIITMVSDFVPGVSLDTLWPQMDETQRSSIKSQLRKQLQLFRSCTQPYIGRVNHKHTRNFYERLGFSFMGPFDSETEFDTWCLSQLKSSVSKMKWKYLLSKLREKKASSQFVLTHGDLAAHNILVKDGQITGIVDWENSGFFPEYMEYVVAMKICDHEDWWRAVLKEVLEPCNAQRLEFHGLIKKRGW